MLRLFVIFSILISPVWADPEDFPPTAFQLAQIRHYADQDKQGRDKYYTQNVEESPCRGYEELIDRAENLLKSRVPQHPTEDDWRLYVQTLVDEITSSRSERLFIESFQEAGTVDLITRAILAEEAASKENNVVFWRASQAPVEIESEKRTVYFSFSHGLFSGFLFDGYKYHTVPREKTSSCTYTYFSSKTYANRLIRGGVPGFVDRVKESLPEFFSQVSAAEYKHKFGIEEWPHSSDPFWKEITYGYRQNVIRVIDIANEWYSKQDEYQRSQEFMRFISDVNITFKTDDSPRPLHRLSVWGFEFRDTYLKLFRFLAESSRKSGGQGSITRVGDQRGNFVEPHYAVYGAGELYHPKVQLLLNPKVIRLLDNVEP